MLFGKRSWLKWAGRAMLVLFVPLCLLLVAEGALKSVSRGMDPSFVVRDEAGGYWRDNPDVGRLWFAPGLVRAPVPFRVGDARPDLRVAVVGESAAMGDPEPAFGLAATLREVLSRQYPGRTVEVVNAAMTAIDSSIIRAIVRDLAPLRPDVVVVYMGNNEVVGPFGPASSDTPDRKSVV